MGVTNIISPEYHLKLYTIIGVRASNVLLLAADDIDCKLLLLLSIVKDDDDISDASVKFVIVDIVYCIPMFDIIEQSLPLR